MVWSSDLYFGGTEAGSLVPGNHVGSRYTKNTIRQGSRTLITGTNGFIGSHVVDQLLSLGYLVRGTVRESKPWLNELFDQQRQVRNAHCLGPD
ncbi:hypothetical protein N7533_009086 [Penicillium manginii]|uniref:uncharacterized protein n=1 Tax=Penicillium manginii TaxID=203109 RepID=UPI002547FE32|nr:uncharacterized protein N7533_009086 [Penicillium manginii]KAJ5744216.1 hypothetical protein N7533_009086 [Penicillium manginii]